MKPLTLIATIGLIICQSSAAHGQTAGTSGTNPAISASANLVDTQGRSVGLAFLQQTPHGVLLRLELKNATPGLHGLHIHDIGRCDRPSFDSSGGHFNPTGQQHGYMNPRGPHAGDLPNINVPGTTQLTVEYLLPDVALAPGPNSLLDANGAALVIHEGKDDYVSDPAGDSGHRLACGQIVPPDKK